MFFFQKISKMSKRTSKPPKRLTDFEVGIKRRKPDDAIEIQGDQAAVHLPSDDLPGGTNLTISDVSNRIHKLQLKVLL